MQFEIKLGKAYTGITRPKVAEVVSEINARIHQPNYLRWVIGLTVGISVLVIVLAQPWIALGTMTIGSGVGWTLESKRKRNQTTTLTYQLSEDIRLRFSTIQKACKLLAESDKIWLESTRKVVSNQHRNAGASHIINLSKTPVKVQCLPPPFIATNLDIWSIDIGALAIFFLPDCVLIWRRNVYSAMSYSALNLSCDRQQINTANEIPKDARVIGQTWQHVTKFGKPDPNAKNNPRLLQVQYGLLQFLASIGLSFRLHVSNVSLAERFTKTFNSVQQWLTPRQKDDEFGKNDSQQAREKEKQPDAYEVLGIRPGATLIEIRSAYHHMARMNHPDKVIGLAPEFRQLAEHRMKMITTAYRTLSQQSTPR
ncbi:MAG: J domain-containing protein [Cyanobacteria bacterium P01_E01_bin.6]